MSEFVNIVIGELNAKLGLKLTADDVNLSVPELIDPTVLDHSHPTRRNSRIKVTLRDPSVDPDFEVVFNYNRLDLEKLSAPFSKDFAGGVETSIHEILPRLSTRFRREIATDDIIDAPLVQGEDDTPFVLRAAPESQRYIGAITLSLLGTGQEEPEPVEPSVVVRYNEELLSPFINPETNEIFGAGGWSGIDGSPIFYTVLETDDAIIAVRYYGMTEGPAGSANGNFNLLPGQSAAMTLALHSKDGSVVTRFVDSKLISSLLAASYSSITSEFSIPSMELEFWGDGDEPEIRESLFIDFPSMDYQMRPSYFSPDGSTVIFHMAAGVQEEDLPASFGIEFSIGEETSRHTFSLLESAAAKFNRPLAARFADDSGAPLINPTATPSNAWAFLLTEVGYAAGLYAPSLNSYVPSGYTGGYGAAALTAEGHNDWYFDLLIGVERGSTDTVDSLLAKIYGTQTGAPAQIVMSHSGGSQTGVVVPTDNVPRLIFDQASFTGTVISTPSEVVVHFRLTAADLMSEFGSNASDFNFTFQQDGEDKSLSVALENRRQGLAGTSLYLAGQGWGSEDKREIIDLTQFPALSHIALDNNNAPFAQSTEGQRTAFLRHSDGSQLALTDVSAPGLTLPNMQLRRSVDNGLTWRTIGEIPSPEGLYWNRPLALAEFAGRIYFVFLIDDMMEGTQCFGMAYFTGNPDVLHAADVVEVPAIQSAPAGWPNRPGATALVPTTDGQSLVMIQSVTDSGQGTVTTSMTLLDAAGEMTHVPLDNTQSDAQGAGTSFSPGTFLGMYDNRVHVMLSAAQYTNENIFNSRPQVLYVSYQIDGLVASDKVERWLISDLTDTSIKTIGTPGGLQVGSWFIVSTFENMLQNGTAQFGNFFALDMSQVDPAWFLMAENTHVCGEPAPQFIVQDNQAYVFGYRYNNGTNEFSAFEFEMPPAPNMVLNVQNIQHDGVPNYYSRHSKVIGGALIDSLEPEVPVEGQCFDAFSVLMDSMTGQPATLPLENVSNANNGLLYSLALGSGGINPEGQRLNTVRVRGTLTASEVNSPIVVFYQGENSAEFPIQSGVPFDVTFNTTNTRWDEFLNVDVYVLADGLIIAGGDTLPPSSVTLSLTIDSVQACFVEVEPLAVKLVDASLPGWAYGNLDNIEWREAPLYSLPEQPVQYPPAVFIPLPPSGDHNFTAVASNTADPGGTVDGGSDVSNVVQWSTGRVETTDDILATPYSFGFGNRNVSVWMNAVDDIPLAGLASEYVLAPELAQFADSVQRPGRIEVRAEGTVEARDIEGNVSSQFYVNSRGGSLFEKQPSTSATHDGSLDYVEDNWMPAVNAMGILTQLSMDVFVSSNVNLTQPVRLRFALDVEYGIQPLPATPMVLRNVRVITYDDFPDMDLLGQYEIPQDDDVGSSVGDLIVVDDSGYFAIKNLPGAISSGALVVGDFYYANDLNTKLATVAIRDSGGGA